MMTINPLDPVALREDIAALALKAGDVGTVVDIDELGSVEVEFVDEFGETIALAKVDAQFLRRPSKKELSRWPTPPLAASSNLD